MTLLYLNFMSFSLVLFLVFTNYHLSKSIMQSIKKECIFRFVKSSRVYNYFLGFILILSY